MIVAVALIVLDLRTRGTVSGEGIIRFSGWIDWIAYANCSVMRQRQARAYVKAIESSALAGNNARRTAGRMGA
ncbi:hypothetical protein GCM10010433_21850 [Streptomyces pulveraceus]